MEELQVDIPTTETVSSIHNPTQRVDPSSDSDDEDITFTKPKKKLIHLSDSDSEELTPNIPTMENQNSDQESDLEMNTTDQKLTRIVNNDSDSDESSLSKRQLSPKLYENVSEPCVDDDSNIFNEKDNDAFKSKLSALCDPESSDDEAYRYNDVSSQKKNLEEAKHLNSTQENKIRATQRMSAKQAMEQMHKINSESSRMLREKDVYLPYHRPKQISLKEFISKKNITFIPGVKRQTFRMNAEELKEYAIQLEQREKEVIELFESESDDETQNTDKVIISDSIEILPANKLEELPVAMEVNDEINALTSTETTLENSGNIDKIASQCNSSDENPLLFDEEESPVIIKDIEMCITNLENDLTKAENIEDAAMQPTIELSVTQPMNMGCEDSPMNLKRQLLEHISCSLPNPKLSGFSDGFIDLTSGAFKEELSGVSALKKKFLFHASLKSPAELAREKEKTDIPGTALMNFKRDLIDHISEQRLQEWKRKNEEEQSRKREEKVNDELSDCEDMLEVENEKYDKLEALADSEVEDEPDIEDEEEEMPIKESKKSKCDYIDEEAELDDDEASDDESDDDSSSEPEVESVHQSTDKKKPTRIIKPIDSDGSDEDGSNLDKGDAKDSSSILKTDDANALKTRISANTLGSVDMFGTPDVNKNDSFNFDSDDHLTLGQKCLPSQLEISPVISSKPKLSGLASLISPLTKLSPSAVTSSESINDELNKTLPTQNTLDEKAGWNDLQKRLFTETDTTENTQDTQEIADLCSGKFPTQQMNTTITESDTLFDKTTSLADTQMIQSTESELLELCTGKFEGINDTATEEQLELLDDIDVLKNNSDVTLIVQPLTALSEKPGEIINSKDILKPSKTKPKCNNIMSFFMPVNKTDIITTTKPSKTVENVIEANEEVLNTKYAILSSTSSDERENIEADIINDDNKKKVKILKSRHDRNKKRKAQPLLMSDDESEDELSNDDISVSNIEDLNDDDKQVEYDSEENEIELIPEKIVSEPKKKQTSEFFEQEAELTTDDEYRGSGDEDERGLNEFEWEEGDADQLDQRKVNKELEKIHRHQMLDQDKREIKLLQDILLEDGDLEGGTRERKFRWKNVDTNIESGAVVGDDNHEDGFDDQSEELWRRQRYERETFLREMHEKHEATQNPEEAKSTPLMTSRLSFIKASLKSSIKPIQDDSDNSVIMANISQNECNESEKFNKKPLKDLPSPVKKPFMLIPHNYKGSFINRGQAALDRLVLMTKGNIPANGNDPPKNLSSLAPGKRKNFVFETISPPCNNEKSEDIKLMKRKMASEISTPNSEGSSKKLKISDEFSRKSKKSLLDYME